MIWILLVVILCLIVVLAQLMLSYQKRANDLRMKQEPLRLRIRKHNKALQEMVEKSQEAAMPHIDELQNKIDEFTQLANEYRPLLAELEREGHDSGLLVEEEKEEDSLLDDEKDPSMLVDLERWEEEDDELDLAAMVRDTQTYQDQVDLHLGDLKRDLDIVTKTLSRMQDRAGAGNKRSEEGARDDGDD